MKYASSESEEEMEQAQIRKKEFVSLKFIRQSFAFYSSLKERIRKRIFQLTWNWNESKERKRKFSWEFSFLSSPLDRVYAVIEEGIEGVLIWGDVGFNWVELWKKQRKENNWIRLEVDCIDEHFF